MSYRLTEPADADLLAILMNGIERFGVEQALSYRQALERTLELLGAHPGMGRLRVELHPPVRAFPFRSHVIVYDVQEAAIVIFRIRHGREDWISSPI